VVQTTVDEWNGVATTGVTARWTAEAAESEDDSPTLTQPSVKVHRADAFVPFSVEIGGDWAAFESDIRMAFADARDRLEGTAFISGAGDSSNVPYGILTALGTASDVAPTTPETFADDDVYKTQSALPPRYRQRPGQASWVASFDTFNKIRQLFSGDNVWTDPAAGVPARLLGWSAY